MGLLSAFTAARVRRAGARHGGGVPRVASVSDLEQARRRRSASINAARAVIAQRLGYARAVLAGVARTHRAMAIAQIHKTLTQALGPLSVRLSPDVARERAGHIQAGRPVELP